MNITLDLDLTVTPDAGHSASLHGASIFSNHWLTNRTNTCAINVPLFDVGDHLSVMGMLPAIEPGLAGILYNLVKIFETVYIYSVTAWVHSGATKRMDIAEFTNQWLASFAPN